jgi:hypothetical protein
MNSPSFGGKQTLSTKLSDAPSKIYTWDGKEIVKVNKGISATAIVIYTILIMAVPVGIAVVGIVFFIIACVKKKFTVDGGILPPVKQGRYSALFLNVGTALTIAFFAYTFVRWMVR